MSSIKSLTTKHLKENIKSSESLVDRAISLDRLERVKALTYQDLLRGLLASFTIKLSMIQVKNECMM